MRIGHGYDVHRLVEGRELVLCGVKIPSEVGLLGHSDADVAVHALMDALLGAAALGDIGRLFPDSDARFEGISSLRLLERVMELISRQGYQVVNADITIVAEKPKISRYVDEMRAVLAPYLGVGTGDVNVKGTTEEKLGFTNGTAIAAHAVVLID